MLAEPIDKRKPRGYWEILDNVKNELNLIINSEIKDDNQKIIKKRGEFPTRRHLEYAGKPIMVRAIRKKHGGLRKMRKLFGHDPIRQPDGYWLDRERVLTELKEIISKEYGENGTIKKAGGFPTYKFLDYIGRKDLNHAIARYHGGLSNLCKEMGYECRKHAKNQIHSIKEKDAKEETISPILKKRTERALNKLENTVERLASLKLTAKITSSANLDAKLIKEEEKVERTVKAPSKIITPIISTYAKIRKEKLDSSAGKETKRPAPSAINKKIEEHITADHGSKDFNEKIEKYVRSFPDLSPIGRLAGIDRIVRIDAPNLGVSEDSAKKILKKRLIDEYHITEDTDTKIFKACKTNLEIQKEDILNSQTGEDDILDGNNAPDAGAYEESPNKKNKPGNNPGQKTIKIGKKAKPRNKLSPKPNEASHQDVHLDGKFAYLNDGFVSKEKRMPSDQEIFWLYTVLEKTPDEIAKMFGGFESDIEKKCKDLD